MNRIPIRLRLTGVFALAMAIVLVAVGAFVHLRLGASLGEQLDDVLEARAEALAEAVQRDGVPPALRGGDEELAQVLGRRGEVLAASPGLGDAPLLSAAERERAAAGALTVERDLEAPGYDGGRARILARSLGNGRTVAVAGSLSDRDEALDGLLAQLLIGGPIALLLASLGGYVLAGAALGPVEAMRRRAGEISAETPGRRLPLPAARDEVFRLGETLNAMLDRLDDGLRRERRFVADASHELRTPLSLLQTELELALRRPRTQPELELALRSAAEEVERLTRLAEDLLVLASAEEGRLSLRTTELPVQELLAGVARRFAPRAMAAGRPLEIAGDASGTLRGDRLRLEQALGNLIDNALRHGAGAVRLEAVEEGSSTELRVRDEGPGFPAEFIARAFERLSRADEARPRGGAGLGLAIVDAVARAHGGSAQAANDPAGAVVAIVLPRGTRKASSTERGSRSRGTSGPRPLP